MTVHDLWRKTENGKRVPSQRDGIGKRYRVSYTRGGKVRTKSFALKREAVQFDNNTHTDLARGEFIDPKKGSATLRQMAEHWRQAQLHRDSTQISVEYALNAMILPHLGDQPIGPITKTDIRKWVKASSERWAPSTIEPAFRYLSSVFKMAVEEKVIKENPCKGVKLPDKTRARIEPVPVEFVHELANQISPRYQAMIWVGAATGLRESEVAGLEVRDIDWLRKKVRVKQQLECLPGRPGRLAEPKSAASYREVPVDEWLIKVLAKHVEDFPPLELDILDNTVRPMVRAARLLFSSATRTPLRRQNFGDAMRRARTKALGILCENDPDLARFSTASFHDLRHFYASLLIRYGASVRVVQTRLGHKTAQETLKTYLHLWPDADDHTRDAVTQGLRLTQTQTQQPAPLRTTA